ncbi:hypothetical protein HBI25_207540 [Parastagonospora nodorum]|nr:hypothetical protein HBH53_237630 [Parastagonospora nodorum]KAH4112265.1 hypothetical protein HBH47_227990 [Parastagonospora nodorum]KAH4289600.1 hypothetical protein HBI02_205300 [Parastagonospora nodorum]KAH4289997.1 hypothetical protein HBI01_204110 [Parastagonospora nodorum]KAH4322414.1 hypothetical protein HBI00_200260 [Parastagonospora nodorum]
MAFLLCPQLPITRCFMQTGGWIRADSQISNARSLQKFAHARFASRSSRPQKLPKGSKPIKPTVRRNAEPYTRKLQPDLSTSKKAASLLNHVNKLKREASIEAKVVAPKIEHPAPVVEAQIVPKEDGTKTVEIDEEELAIQRRIVKNRRKIFWPGVWTVFAVAGTYGVFAFLDTKFGSQSTEESAPSERAQIPQTWYMTPTVVIEGVKAGWAELDKLTIGIAVLCVAMHFLRKSPLPIWERLIHITGEKRYTAFTYPLIHSNWAHLGNNFFGLCWFLPGVVHYFDNDSFHAATFLITIPLITTFLQHFVFRWTTVRGIPLNMGASGAIAAALGAFCMAYPDEKVWTPNFLVFRMDAKYCGVLYVAWQLVSEIKAPKGGGSRPDFIVHTLSLLLGAAYVYFDVKENVWKPLVAQFATTDDQSAQS